MAKKIIIGSVNCCGATISHAKTYNRARSRGIYIFPGVVGKEKDDDKDQIKHVKTKNGDVTIAVKLWW